MSVKSQIFGHTLIGKLISTFGNMHYRMIVKWTLFIGKTIMRTLLNVINILVVLNLGASEVIKF